MANIFSYLHEFTFVSIIFRLFIALLCGGLIGLGRETKGRAAGFRTYMLTSLGAALTILLACYEFQMLSTTWADLIPEAALKFDGSRYSAQVINGIGFLGAGTILKSTHRQITGLTTASGLWASACLGIAAGAGFFECIFISVLLIIFVMEVLPKYEAMIISKSRMCSIYVEFHNLENVHEITATIKNNHAEVKEIEVERQKGNDFYHASAVFTILLEKGFSSHNHICSCIEELDSVYITREIS